MFRFGKGLNISGMTERGLISQEEFYLVELVKWENYTLADTHRRMARWTDGLYRQKALQ
jgi:hypothetical protein